MKKLHSILFAVLTASASYAAELWYQAVDDVRSWDTLAAWQGANALPTSTDIINLNNSSIVVPNYLRITNGVTALASVLHIGDQKMEDGRLVGLKIEQGGTLNLTASGTFNLIVGNEGRGALWLDGGEVKASGWNVFIGNHTGSYGEIVVGHGAAFTPAEQNSQWKKSMIVGLYGIGKMTTFADIGFPLMELRIGGTTQGWSSFHAAGSTVLCDICQVGGIVYYGEEVGIQNVRNDLPGYGELILSNATLKIASVLPENTVAQFSIGRFDGGYGILRGCGAVQGSGADSNNVRIWMNEGQIIADGFGEEAALDLNSVVSIRNNTSEIAADTTNGWYAVNKGAALFPRIWFSSDSTTTVVGGWSGDTDPGFVNSVGVSVSGVEGSNRHLRGGLFADGRSDVHADLMPRNDGVIGIWKIGMTASVSGSDVLDYGSADLTFRYDQSKVNVGEPIALYRWNGFRWERVAEKIADSTFKISASDLVRPASYGGIYNIGTFALVKKDLKGLVITVL